MFRRLLVTVFLLISACGWAIAAPGETLYVKGNSVNIRSGPSTGTKVVAKLENGHALTEIGRDGHWINITIARRDGATGWIREDLTSASPAPTRPSDTQITPPDAGALGSAQGVADALRAVPRTRLRDGLRAAIWQAGFPCPGGVVGHREVMVRVEGAYYVAACKNKLRYSVLVRPDGRMGTRVLSCQGMERLTGVDPCARK